MPGEPDRDHETPAPKATAERAPYAAPALMPLGSASTVTQAVSMRGLLDGFMMRRTG